MIINEEGRVMMVYDNITIYTADDEEPRCGMCDNVCDGNDKLCVERCGAEHGWGGYSRTEEREVSK